MGIEELAPVAVFAAVFGRVDAMVGENPFDGHETDLMAEIFEVISDPLVAPVGIVIADFHHQSDGFLIEHPASAFLLSRPRAVVLFGDQLVIPVYQSIRRPGGFRELQKMGIECPGLAGKALAVGIVEFRPFLSSRFLVLFLIDAELFRLVLNGGLEIFHHFTGFTVAHPAHKGIKLRIDVLRCHI